MRDLAMPSIAYRLALTAAGEGVAGVSLAGACSWDYAGAHALLRGAGGVLVDESGREVGYDDRGRSRTSRCFGGAPEVVRALVTRPWASVFRKDCGPTPDYPLEWPRPGRLARDAGVGRAQGALLGQLAGDALGSSWKSRAPIARRFPEGVRDLVDGGRGTPSRGSPPTTPRWR